jgi:hypothetical protein
MKLTKAMVDNLASLKLRVDKLKAELKQAETVYERELKPVAEYVNSEAKPEQSLNLTGVTMLMEFGKQREVRKLVSPVEALLKLEKVEKGLGYANISIPIGVLDKYLRPGEEEGLFTSEYGARSVKVTKLVQ